MMFHVPPYSGACQALYDGYGVVCHHHQTGDTYQPHIALQNNEYRTICAHGSLNIFGYPGEGAYGATQTFISMIRLHHEHYNCLCLVSAKHRCIDFQFQCERNAVAWAKKYVGKEDVR